MNNRYFWDLIEKAKYEENPIEWLVHSLSNHSATGVIHYELHFLQAYESSYTSRLWGAAYIILGGCSDDSFDYFRAWLISQGENIYKKTIQNPEILAKLIPKAYEEEGIIPEFEDFINVGFEAFSRVKTGKAGDSDELYHSFLEALEQFGYKSKRQDIEFDWENENDLKRLYPKLWKRFGDNPLG